MKVCEIHERNVTESKEQSRELFKKMKAALSSVGYEDVLAYDRELVS